MSEFLLGCTLGFLFVGCIAAPFVGPWRVRLRYLVAAQVADRAFSRELCTPAIVAKLDGWSTTHEPVLMVVDESGDIHLYGPDGVVTYLNRAEERTR